MFDKLCVDVGDDNRSLLALLLEEFIHYSTDLIEEQGIQLSGHLLTNQLFHMFLNLRSKLFVVADQETKQLTDESENEKGRDLIRGSFGPNSIFETLD